jgi:Flp pilus assembly protein protease CpaA
MEVCMALADYALALCALLGTLLIPFVVLLQMLRLKRRTIRVTFQPTAPRGNRS